MKLSKTTIIGIIGLTAFALVGLMIIQAYWLREGIALYEAQMSSRISILNERISQEIQRDEELMHNILHVQENGRFPYLFSQKAHLKEVEVRIKAHIDRVFQLHQLDMEYDLSAMFERQGICWFPALSSAGSTVSPMGCANEMLCFQPTQQAGYFDLGLSYHAGCAPVPKELIWLGVSTVLFVLILIGTFGFTIFAVHRQKKLSELKTDFINNLTHEFKTPIFSINLGAKMIQETQQVQSSEKLQTYTQLILRENQRLRDQVDKVLQIGMMDSGNVCLDKDLMDVHELIDHTAQSFETLIDEREGSLSLDFQAKKSLIFGDQARLRDLFYNLLDNAYKYSPETPHITIRTEDYNKGIKVRIKDQGIGMNPKVLQQMYTKFYRADGGDVHDVKGFGLGLSYVKSILDLHGGQIQCNSCPGKGSEFIVHIPMT
ncbi:MAG: HAMP domain-containing sensor histidine kinase [Bacteroidota bacterium]